ncbi:MAG TPA: hypothetical protein DCZ40_03535 [Lachnospiraceae bacterium]|nr:hypothetical protein [Lachnospiraceae bacterium]
MGLLQRSIAAGVFILCILVLRKFAFRKLSKRVFAMLWRMAVWRLLIPFSFQVENVFFRQRADDIMILARNGAAETASGAEVLGMAGFWLKHIGMVWFLGTAVMALFFAAEYVRAYFRLREAIPLKDWKDLGIDCGKSKSFWRGRVGVSTLDRIAAPVTCGIIRPRIILPRVMNLEDKDRCSYVLRHEMTHIRYMDNLWKLLAIAALCLHWFNPLVFVMVFTMNKDLEIACDESVISVMDEKDRKNYAMTLVELAEFHALFPLAYSGFGRSAVPERISEIMNYKKMTKIGSLCAALVLLGSTAVFVSAKETGREETAAAASPSASVEIMEEDMGKTDDKDCASVYFEEGISEERIEEIGNELLAVQGVAGIGYTSGDDAWAMFSQEYLDEETVLSFKGVNPLKDSSSYTVYLSENSGDAIRTIEQIAGVRRVIKE